VHGIVTTLKTAQIHPVVQSVPFDLRTSLHVFRNVHAALGLVNVNFADRRRDGCYLTLDAGADAGETPALRVHYEPPPGERARIRVALGRFRKALWKLGCVVPPGMSHVRPMGASVHYAGTLPMTREERPLTTTPECRSRDFDNLWIADGSTFPFLPAKNLTLTLMANAARIADGMPPPA
jgi:choline dehydrogenase-like flavoprotein